jgi:hypothetical protein
MTRSVARIHLTYHYGICQCNVLLSDAGVKTAFSKCIAVKLIKGLLVLIAALLSRLLRLKLCRHRTLEQSPSAQWMELAVYVPVNFS